MIDTFLWRLFCFVLAVRTAPTRVLFGLALFGGGPKRELLDLEIRDGEAICGSGGS
jgi:hypothetical protein